MPRDGLTAGVIAELTAHLNKPFILLKLELDAGDEFQTDCPASLTWDGETWESQGCQVGDVDINENGASRLDIAYPGYPNPMATTIGQGLHYGKTGTAWEAYVDANGDVIADPVMLITGECSGSGIDAAGCGFTIFEGSGASRSMIPHETWDMAGASHCPKDGAEWTVGDTTFTLKTRD